MNSMGKGAYNRLIALGIKTINAENKSVEDALNSYLAQELNVELVGHECHGCGTHGKGHHHGSCDIYCDCSCAWDIIL